LGRALARPFSYGLCGLIQRAPNRIPSPIAAGNSQSHVPPAASAAAAAQEIDENASAKVAKREAVWRWRKWRRVACLRNQNWMLVAAAAAIVIPIVAMIVPVSDRNAS